MWSRGLLRLCKEGKHEMSKLAEVIEQERRWLVGREFGEMMDRIEAAARADHPEDGEIRNIKVQVFGGESGGCDYIFQYAFNGRWKDSMVSVSQHGLTALRQLAKEGRL